MLILNDFTGHRHARPGISPSRRVIPKACRGVAA